MSEYRILITHTVWGHYYFEIINDLNNKPFAKSVEYSRKENCEFVANKLATALNCEIEFFDLELDIEE